MKISKEVKIGLTVAVSFVVLAWGVNFLKGRNVFKVGTKHYGVYSNVSGLNEGSPIFFKGFKIGSVLNIELHPNLSGDLLVTFLLVKDIDFPKNSLARIYSLDLMGSKGVEFVPGDSPEFLIPEDTINTYVVGDFKDQLSMEMLPLKEKTEKLIVRFDSLLIHVTQLFTDENKKNMSAAIEGFSKTMAHTEDLSYNLASSFEEGGSYFNLVARLDSVLQTLNRQGPAIDSTFKNINGFAKQLNQVNMESTLVALKRSLEETTKMMNGVNQGDGSLGLLMNDKELYYNLADASANLNRLLMDVRLQPKKYVSFSALDFGKNVYLEPTGGAIEGIVFQVKIRESKHPVRLDSLEVVGKYRIFEDFDGRKFYYTIGQSKDYNKIKTVLEEALQIYPESEVVALENGRLISLSKGLRKKE